VRSDCFARRMMGIPRRAGAKSKAVVMLALK
jgi:hypothetical protein